MVGWERTPISTPGPFLALQCVCEPGLLPGMGVLIKVDGHEVLTFVPEDFFFFFFSILGIFRSLLDLPRERCRDWRK